jgi:hypothetical protein
MRQMVISLSLCIMVSLMAGCAPSADEVKALEEYRMPTEVLGAPALNQTVEAEIVSRIPPRDCPVTIPVKSAFEAPDPYSPSATWEGISWFGSDHLWTALHNDGVWAGLPLNSDGYTQKIMWWSSLYNLPAEPEPALVVTGRRLDGDAPALRFYGATNAMADDIGEAMLTGVEFPTLGCWEITGQYKKTGLTFVVWIAP